MDTQAAATRPVALNSDLQPSASGAFFDELKSLTDAISAGDYRHPEALAASQATALNAMFARIASVAMGDMQHPHFDSLMKLAFRAQDLSCRALNTLNTLVESDGSYYRHNYLERHQGKANRKPEPTPPNPRSH